MILTDVLTACDLNPEYCKFIPIFIKTWKRLFPEINIHIILISMKITDELKPYEEYIKLFPPLKNISTAFIAQNIRLLYPALLNESKGGIIITDMDMVPMGEKYYTDQIKDFDSSKFICYRPLDCVGENQMVICYNIAHYNIWSEIFDIKTKSDIMKKLIFLYKHVKYENIHGGISWCTDQLYLFKATQDWNEKTKSLIILNEKLIEHVKDINSNTNFYTRISIWNLNESNILKCNVPKNLLVDFHIPRSHDLNDVDNIINLLT
jgi:hypothetical protein